MLGYNSNPVAFDNKGFVQKKDPSQLSAGEFYQLENAYSQQEGALTARTGHQRLTSASLAAACVSISKLNLGGVDSSNPRYVGSGTGIYRSDPSYSLSLVYSGMAAGTRWSAHQYNAGTAGAPSLYFATKSGAIRDNGLYATLQKWGIDPPAVPVSATVNVPNSISLNILGGGGSARFVPGVNSDGGGNKTITFIGTGPGYTKITPTAGGTQLGVNGIFVGMLLTITDTDAGSETIIVLAVDTTSCYGVTTINHGASVLAHVTLAYTQNTLAISGAAAPGSTEFVFTGFSIDASFNGVSANGYDTDDPFHIGLRVTDAVNITKLQVIVVPNFTGIPLPNATDYYEYDIYPAVSMSSGTANSPVWLEINIPKNSFKKVGNAGSGAFTWKNITEVYVIANYTASPAAPLTATVGISSLYFVGGGGLNSSAAGTTAYDWLIAYRNPTSQAVGNPCQPMIPANLPPPITNGKVTLTLTGTAQAATIANGIGELSGPGSIKIYRRGGTFSDGFYRHVGYAANPGSGGTVTFVDNASDQSINGADTLEFDNDPPVPSSLPVPLIANITSFQPAGGGGGSTTNTANTTARMILGSLPTNFVAATIGTTITVGSTVQIGFGDTFELSIASAVGYNGANAYIEVFLQYAHKITANDSSETVECDAILRGTCDLVHEDFDCLFLAGDSNNPATLYQSKVGRPESFPVQNLENKFVQQTNVGSPSNPIYGITSIGPGEIVCLNLDNIFIVQMWAGQMQQPVQAPASRGLYAKWCWCKGDNRIWYLAYDGIYTWAGGESQKVSNSIDFMFKKQTVNGIAPVDFTQALKFSFAYAQNSLYVTVIDTGGVYRRLRYESIYDRWTLETIYQAAGAALPTYTIDAMFAEPDTGNLLVSVTSGAGSSALWLADFYSTTDGWVTSPNDGIPIKYTIWRYWPLGDVGTDYQVGEVVMEMANPADSVSASLFYNYSTAATETLVIPVNQVPTRGRYISTVNSGVPQTAYAIGLRITGVTGDGAPVTFFTFLWRELKLEEVTTGPTTDWMTFGYQYDKLIWDLAVQYDTGGKDITVFLDTINGIQGNTQNLAVATYHLTGAGRSQQTFIVPDQTIAKMLRLRPQYAVDLRQFKFWDWTPRFDQLPPDSINSTPWTNSDYGCDKTFKSMNIQVDTGGVPASVAFQIDGATVYTFNVTGTFQNRGSIITLPSNLTGKEWRLVPTPGPGGKFQLYGVQPYFEKQPCAITHFDSLGQIFGSEGYKIIWQIWVDYQSNVPLVLSLYRDGNVLFLQQTLPAQAQRAVQRFKLPAVNTPAGATAPQLNKSISYQILLDSSDGATPFKMYRDGSRVEVRQLSSDQRASFDQKIIWELIPLEA